MSEGRGHADVGTEAPAGPEAGGAARIAALRAQQIFLVRCGTRDVEPIEERPRVLRPAEVDIADPFRVAYLAIVVDFGVGEQLDLVLDLPRHLLPDSQPPQIAGVLVDAPPHVAPPLCL